jgi:S-DNA-T family DNA segregation ATPase FtsK/SpoIIIE
MTRVYADGPQAGIHLAVTADRPNSVPGTWLAVTTQKWLFRLPDPYDYVSFGLSRKDVPRATPGRAVLAENGVQIQVGRAVPSFGEVAAAVAARHAGSTPSAAREVTIDAVSSLGEEPWRIAIGMRESDLGAAELALYDGEHAIVAGPARSGKSLALPGAGRRRRRPPLPAARLPCARARRRDRRRSRGAAGHGRAAGGARRRCRGRRGA